MLQRTPIRPEKPERQTVGTLKEPELQKNTGTKNSQSVDYVQKTTKHRKEPELPKHRKFDSSGRYPRTSTSGRRSVESRCEIGDRYSCPLRWSKTQSREPQEAAASVVKAWTRAEEPKYPKSLKLSLRGSVETQAQHRQDRLGEPWSGSL
jgi:hypothetical protein